MYQVVKLYPACRPEKMNKFAFLCDIEHFQFFWVPRVTYCYGSSCIVRFKRGFILGLKVIYWCISLKIVFFAPEDSLDKLSVLSSIVMITKKGSNPGKFHDSRGRNSCARAGSYMSYSGNALFLLEISLSTPGHRSDNLRI